MKKEWNNKCDNKTDWIQRPHRQQQRVGKQRQEGKVHQWQLLQQHGVDNHRMWWSSTRSELDRDIWKTSFNSTLLTNIEETQLPYWEQQFDWWHLWLQRLLPVSRSASVSTADFFHNNLSRTASTTASFRVSSISAISQWHRPHAQQKILLRLWHLYNKFFFWFQGVQ